MKSYFTLNNRRYEAKDFDFNLICDLSEQGVEIEKIDKKATLAIRAYVALCGDMDKTVAGNEIQAHIIGGGNVNEIAEVMLKKLEESDFFQALNKTAETTTQPKKTKEGKEK